MRVGSQRFAVLSLDLDGLGRSPSRQRLWRAPKKHARKPSVSHQGLKISIAKIIKQRAVCEQRMRSARHQHANGQQVDQPRFPIRLRGFQRSRRP